MAAVRFSLKRVGAVILPGRNAERRVVLGHDVFTAAILQNGLALEDLQIFILARVEMMWGLLLEEILAFLKIEVDVEGKISIWMADHPRAHSAVETW